MAKFRVFFLIAVLLLSSSSFIQVARCQSDSDSDTNADLVAETVKEGGDIGGVGDDFQNYEGWNFSPASGVDTVCVFPKNPSKLVVAGEDTELLIGLKNEGLRMVENGYQRFNNASVPALVQATYPYTFSVSKYLQAGTFDLVGMIIYEVDQLPYQNIFYNGTIEVTEAGGVVSVETLFLISLGIALFVLFGLWARGQMQNLSKKTKKVSKVETGTKTVDASMDEWLQGTAYTQLNKSKKKK